MSEGEIVNRVSQSPLVTLDLEQFLVDGDRVVFDIKEHLFEGLILKEKDFRAFLKTNDWSGYSGKHVAVTCTADAIIPTWAYMLLTVQLKPFARTIVYGDLSVLEDAIIRESLEETQWSDFHDKKIVIKGCSKIKNPDLVFMEVTKRLLPYASSIMYGEPCSTVPIYKKPVQR